jgi:peptide/nickel transport system permease protein
MRQGAKTPASEGPRPSRHLARRLPFYIGLVIVVAFYGWSLVEGLLQLFAVWLHMPSLAWALLPHDPFSLSLGNALQPPSQAYPFGTDDLGRDLLSRILYAAPVDALVSIAVVAGGVAIGGVIGLVAGYFGKGIEEVNMRLTDLFLAFPALILALVIESIFGRSATYATIAMIVVWWPSYARLFRGEMLEIKNKKFIQAAYLSGLSDREIIFSHALRSALNTITSYATIDLGNALVTYSILSFLGLGVPPPFPEWGTLVSDGLNFFPQQWWYSIIPGAVITVIVIAVALVGDGLRDLLAGEF